MSKKSNVIRQYVRRFHLWLGFVSGLIIFIVSITGCILVFQDDIKDLLHPYRSIERETTPFLQASDLKNKALEAFPSATATRLHLYKDRRPAAIMISRGNERYFVYVNPYTGKVLHTENIRDDFFFTVQHLHTHLLLPGNIGQPVVDIAVVVFVLMLLSGLILWYPRKKEQRRQRLTVRWNSRWRRLNYDLHNVPGFYAVLVSFVIAITGLSMSYQWLRESLSKAANLGNTYASEKEKFPVSDTIYKIKLHPDSVLDISFRSMRKLDPQSEMVIGFFPFGNTGVYSISGYARQLHYYKRNDYYFDQYKGNLIKSLKHNSRSPGAKLSSMNYDIHTGQILGFAGKIIAFLASLICASLPVTGFLLWWGRRYKTKKVIAHKTTTSVK